VKTLNLREFKQHEAQSSMAAARKARSSPANIHHFSCRDANGGVASLSIPIQENQEKWI